MSQIGYMILAAGLGPVGYVFAIFHLLTHGVLQGGLFLGAGSVMHGMNDQVNMRRYGALRTVMTVTWVTFGPATWRSSASRRSPGSSARTRSSTRPSGEHPVAGVAAIIGAGITAFYMTRMMAMTFHGKSRWEDGVHPHESRR
jgi:NADH-quinone oxidoreductase subunit L